MPLSTSEHKPEQDRPDVDRGEVQHAPTGYSYWATAEDEEQHDARSVLAAKALREKAAVETPKKPRRASGLVWALLTLSLGLLAYFGFSLFQVYQAADTNQLRQSDAIVVLGAAQFNGEPSPVLQGRLDHAFTLYDEGLAPYIVTTGSKQEGDAFTEGDTGARYLRGLGVPEEALIRIVDGDDTWQQISATAYQLEQRELSTILIVSDGYHNFRARAIAEEFGIEAAVSPTGLDGTLRDYVREGVAVSIGRLIGFDRISGLRGSND